MTGTAETAVSMRLPLATSSPGFGPDVIIYSTQSRFRPRKSLRLIDVMSMAGRGWGHNQAAVFADISTRSILFVGTRAA